MFGTAIELKRVRMRTSFAVFVVVAGWLLQACAPTEWVHPKKPSEEFANDSNRCNAMALADPKVQNSQLLMSNAVDRCLQREGWRLVTK